VTAFAAGGVDYVSKPFQIEELLARVKTHLALRATQAHLVAQDQALQTEITARHSAEMSLQASELRYRRLFETANDGIILIDFETGKITGANPAILAMLDCERSDLIDRQLCELDAFAGISACQTALSELHHQDTIQRDDWILMTRSGASVHVEMVGNIRGRGCPDRPVQYPRHHRQKGS
jgi:PAS domain S-box-containing protein